MEQYPLTGETVTLSVGGVSTKCLIFHSAGGSMMAVPLQPSPALQSATKKMPANCTIHRTDGTAHRFSLNSQGAVQVFVGELHESLPNRRRYYRIKLDFNIKLSTDGKMWYPARGEDISEGGLLVTGIGGLTFTVGEMLYLAIYMPGCDPIVATAIVRRMVHDAASGAVKSYGMQFINMPTEGATRLTQFIYHFQKQNKSSDVQS